MDTKGPKLRLGRRLMDGIYRLTVLISTVIIVVIMVASALAITYFMARDFNRNAKATADEIASILAVPMYNVDDKQSIRIAGTLLSSNRVSGVFLESSATGVLVDKRPARGSPWIPMQSRVVQNRGIELGRIEIYYGDAMLNDIIRSILGTMLAIVAAVVGANVAASRVLFRNMARSVFDRLVDGIGEITKGNYGRALDLSGYEDMDSIVRGINEMSEGIRTRNEQLLAANTGLEERVAARTRELEIALSEQRTLQERLVETGKLAALGQLSTGIAHELNTPLGSIKSSAESLVDYFDDYLRLEPGSIVGLDARARELYDRAVSLGWGEVRDMGAPLAGREATRKAAAALESSGLAEGAALAERVVEMGLIKRIDDLVPLLGTGRDLEVLEAAAETVAARRSLEVILESSRRAAAVVAALRSYLSIDADVDRAVVDVPEDISRVLTLMGNMLRHGVSVRTRFAPARVHASPDKLAQVWMNVIKNAVQAMSSRGELEISVETADGIVRASFVDSGSGIPEEIQERVFEPFFTTKLHGDGLGLGLDICKRIVEAYGGTIAFSSAPGRTEFTVRLPAIGYD